MNELSGYVFSSLREGDIAHYRGSGNGLAPILLVAAEESSPGCVERLELEYALKSELDADWAARPVALTHDNGRMTLVLEDPGGTPLDRLLGRPLDMSHFLRIAIPLAGALRHVHERGLIHKNIKPANVLVNGATGAVKFTGFGVASRLLRERQAPLQHVGQVCPEGAGVLAGEADFLAAGRPGVMLHPTMIYGAQGEDNVQRLAALLRQLRDGGMSVLLVEHDMGFVMDLADRVVVLDFGTKIAEGVPAAIKSNPDVIKAYLGAAT